MKGIWTAATFVLALISAGPAAAATFAVVHDGLSRSMFLETGSRKAVGERLEFVAYTVNEPPWKGWASIERLKVRVDCSARSITELEVTPLDDNLQPLAPRPRALEVLEGLGDAGSVCGIPPPPIAVGGYIDRMSAALTLEDAIDITKAWMSKRRRAPEDYRARFLPRGLLSLPEGRLRLVSENGSGVFFIDEARTRRSGDKVEVVELLVRHPRLMGTTDINWQFVVLIETFDCRARTVFAGPSAMFETNGALAGEFPQDVRFAGAVVPPQGDVRHQRMSVVCDALSSPEGATVVGYDAARRLVANTEEWQRLKVRSD